ncbi:hypothetical protein WH47_06589 [Habropoda laboriosa]|uniref:Uncharacterized protein n=2 Tax=Habropoda laboriosa TaxID=597456 RepID=A0A0L7QS18_9HYME|nr:hypothetical protein WH47_06589 [Habropoda laboriosa]
MHLPKFCETYENWPGFCDAFKAMVHDNPNFRDAQKLVSLRSCLVGKAAEKIKSLETTAANYFVTWSILEKYYDDPSIVISNRVHVFFELPVCSRTNVNSLGELLDQATKHYRALQALTLCESFSDTCDHHETRRPYATIVERESMAGFYRPWMSY